MMETLRSKAGEPSSSPSSAPPSSAPPASAPPSSSGIAAATAYPAGLVAPASSTTAAPSPAVPSTSGSSRPFGHAVGSPGGHKPSPSAPSARETGKRGSTRPRPPLKKGQPGGDGDGDGAGRGGQRPDSDRPDPGGTSRQKRCILTLSDGNVVFVVSTARRRFLLPSVGKETVGELKLRIAKEYIHLFGSYFPGIGFPSCKVLEVFFGYMELPGFASGGSLISNSDLGLTAGGSGRGTPAACNLNPSASASGTPAPTLDGSESAGGDTGPTCQYPDEFLVSQAVAEAHSSFLAATVSVLPAPPFRISSPTSRKLFRQCCADGPASSARSTGSDPSCAARSCRPFKFAMRCDSARMFHPSYVSAASGGFAAARWVDGLGGFPKISGEQLTRVPEQTHSGGSPAAAAWLQLVASEVSKPNTSPSAQGVPGESLSGADKSPASHAGPSGSSSGRHQHQKDKRPPRGSKRPRSGAVNLHPSQCLLDSLHRSWIGVRPPKLRRSAAVDGLSASSTVSCALPKDAASGFLRATSWTRTQLRRCEHEAEAAIHAGRATEATEQELLKGPLRTTDANETGDPTQASDCIMGPACADEVRSNELGGEEGPEGSGNSKTSLGRSAGFHAAASCARPRPSDEIVAEHLVQALRLTAPQADVASVGAFPIRTCPSAPAVSAGLAGRIEADRAGGRGGVGTSSAPASAHVITRLFSAVARHPFSTAPTRPSATAISPGNEEPGEPAVAPGFTSSVDKDKDLFTRVANTLNCTMQAARHAGASSLQETLNRRRSLLSSVDLVAALTTLEPASNGSDLLAWLQSQSVRPRVECLRPLAEAFLVDFDVSHTSAHFLAVKKAHSQHPEANVLRVSEAIQSGVLCGLLEDLGILPVTTFGMLPES